MRRITCGSFIAPVRSNPAKCTRRRIRRRRSAVRRRRRFSSSIRPGISSATGAARGGLRLARLQPRHHRGLSRQRVDWGQRPRHASGRARSRTRRAGRRAEPSAGRVPEPGHRVVQRQHGVEVHEGREVPDADREALVEQRQQRRRQPAPAGEDVRRQGDQRALRRRRLRQPSRDRVRRGDRAVQAPLGRVRREAR